MVVQCNNDCAACVFVGDIVAWQLWVRFLQHVIVRDRMRMRLEALRVNKSSDSKDVRNLRNRAGDAEVFTLFHRNNAIRTPSSECLCLLSPADWNVQQLHVESDRLNQHLWTDTHTHTQSIHWDEECSKLQLCVKFRDCTVTSSSSSSSLWPHCQPLTLSFRTHCWPINEIYIQTRYELDPVPKTKTYHFHSVYGS